MTKKLRQKFKYPEKEKKLLECNKKHFSSFEANKTTFNEANKTFFEKVRVRL